MVYVGSLVAFTLLMVNTTSVQLGVNPFSNVLFFLVIHTWNLGDVAFRALTCDIRVHCVHADSLLDYVHLKVSA